MKIVAYPLNSKKPLRLYWVYLDAVSGEVNYVYTDHGKLEANDVRFEVGG